MAKDVLVHQLYARSHGHFETLKAKADLAAELKVHQIQMLQQQLNFKEQENSKCDYRFFSVSQIFILFFSGNSLFDILNYSFRANFRPKRLITESKNPT